LGVREVLPNEAGETAGGDIMEFYLGAYKISLSDTLKGVSTTEGTVEINEENIEDAEVDIQWTSDADSARINKLTYWLYVDGVSGDEPYISEGQGLREKLDEPEGMLADAWDIKYEGLSDPGVTEISVKASGDDEYRLSFTNTQGVDYSNVRYLFASGADSITFGDDDDNLVFDTPSAAAINSTTVAATCFVKKNDYFMVSHNGNTDTGVTRVLRFDSVDTSNNLVQLTDVGTGGTINAQYTALNGSATGDTINVGGYSFDFAVWGMGGTGKDSYLLCVDLDDDNSLITAHRSYAVTEGGAIMDLAVGESVTSYRGNVTAKQVILGLRTDKNNFDEAPTVDEWVNTTVTVSASQAEFDLDVADDAATGLNLKSHEDNDDLSTGMTNYGVFVKEMNEQNDPDSVTIEYPLAQLLPQVFVTFDKTVTMEGGAGSITVEKPQRIDIGSAVLASQVADPTAQNVISVGGPCINEVTAEVMGLTYPACGTDSGMSEDEGLIKLYESGDKVAIVVAGWAAEDTTRATRVLADYKTYQASGKLVGTEVKVTGTSATDFTVSPVTSSASTTEESE
ncbi:hypothetical protein KY363_05430, partial [Candidatus Woesearchaeota archaeon]|nr:hypothetical protein [Candidatus Woesearchaeota archaeon]